MSGIASVILGIISFTLLGGTIPSPVFWLTAVVCLVVAFYRAWLRECKGREDDIARLVGQLADKEQFAEQEMSRREKAWQEERGRLLGQIQERHNQESLRIALNDLIEEGNAIVKALSASDALSLPPGRREDVEEWYGRADQFVGRHFSSFAGHFRSEAGFGLQGMLTGKIERANLVNFMHRRLQRLGELLNRI